MIYTVGIGPSRLTAPAVSAMKYVHIVENKRFGLTCLVFPGVRKCTGDPIERNYRMGTCSNPDCTGPCKTRSEKPRESLTDALARVVVDNRVVVRAIELYEAGITSVNDIVLQINLDKSEGKL